MVLTAEKVNGVVVLKSVIYMRKMDEILADPAYRKVVKDPTSAVEHKIRGLLRSSGFSMEAQKTLMLHASRPPTLYGWQRTHLQDP